MPFPSYGFAMPRSSKDDIYSDEEAAQRRDAVVKRMLDTPPKPHAKPAPKPKERPAQKGRVHRAKSRS
jgi:hypothetical protein